MSLNSISLVGRAGRDPELRFFDGGTSVAKLTLAVDRATKSKEEEPDWFNLEIWGKQAQVAGDYVRKGSLIGVVGRMSCEQWTDRNTGEKRSKPVVKVERLVLLGSKADNAPHQPAEGQTGVPIQGPGGGAADTQTAGAAPFQAASATPAQPVWGGAPITEAEVPF